MPMLASPCPAEPFLSIPAIPFPLVPCRALPFISLLSYPLPEIFQPILLTHCIYFGMFLI
jgi:hypothetical protein